MKPAIEKEPGPVVIGGLGGSGTRVIADMLLRLGYDLGSSLNQALDNLWFTLLLKRPAWLNRPPHPDQIYAALDVFVKAIRQGMETASASERAIVQQAMAEHASHERRMGVRAEEGNCLLAARQQQSATHKWGWKEPNSQIFLPFLIDQLPGLRYIHVVRHGLDMAFSNNQQQVRNWGGWFGLELDLERTPTPAEQLEYWLRTTRHVLALGKEKLGSRFLVVDFDNTWRSPDRVVDRLLSFLDLTPAPEIRQQLIGLPRRPQSAGRWKTMSLEQFSQHQLEAVQQLGYEVHR